MIVAIKIVVWVVAAASAASLASYFLVVRERGWSGSTKGSSRCVCGRPLHGYELIPVISWLLLAGKSNCCKARLPVTYLIVELLSASLGTFGIYHHILWYVLPLVYLAILFIPISLLQTSIPEGSLSYVPSKKRKEVKESLFIDDED
jgi:prepilin signal peptidase PulO-like enzyme (type II secretory pathway)